MASSASYPRKYYFASNDEIIAPNVIPLSAGNVIAAYDTDAIYYDVPNGVGEEVIRRKANGIEFVGNMSDARQEPTTIFIVKTGTTTDESGETINTYSGYRWNNDLSTPAFEEVFNNLRDFKVKSDVISGDTKAYLVGSISNSSTVGTLLKGTPYLTADGKIHADLEGHADTADTAQTAHEADLATNAINDSNEQPITSYFRGASSNYSGGNFSTLTFTLGNGNETEPIKIPNTEYGIFTASTKGLVDSPTPAHTVASDSTNKVLTGSGWMNKDDITIGTATKAVGDKNGNDITDYLYSVVADDNNAATQLLFTHGDSTTQNDIKLKTYDVFTTSTDGLVPAASGTGDTSKFLRGDHTWQSVPIPSTGDATKYLAGDGTWKGVFTSATSSTDGTLGLVPAPEDTDVYKVLSNEGWVVNGTGSSQETDTTRPLYLVGANSQGNANQPMTTYSNANVYAFEGKLYQANDSATPAPVQVVDLSSAQALTNKTYEGYALEDACSYPSTDSIYDTYEDAFEGDGNQKIFNLLHDATNLISVTRAGVVVSHADYTFIQGEEYSDETLYAIDDYCVHDNSIWKCLIPITTTPHEWDSSEWSEIVQNITSPDIVIFNTIPGAGLPIVIRYDQLISNTLPTTDAVSQFVLGLSANHINNQVIADYYDEKTSYLVGQYCMFQYADDDYVKLYRCTHATSGTATNPEDFGPGDWEATVISDILVRVPAPPTTDGTYTLTATVSSGVTTYSWT